MPNWTGILEEMNECRRFDAPDFIRRKYLKQLHDYTGRNVIAYYSGWLQKPGYWNTIIHDDDKNGFMNVIHQMDRSLGLDLILHTPGGDTAATESIVHYLKTMFDSNIRVIVPQLAMSAGTMIACAANEIYMGKQSSLGPIDPQFNGIPAHGVIEEFLRAIEEIKADPTTIPIWQVIVQKYHPTFIGECEKAINWSSEMVTKWLIDGMFKNDPNAGDKANCIVEALNNHENSKTHARHLSYDECEKIGLNIRMIENYDTDGVFQDIVLSIHHSFMHTFAGTTAIKIIENHDGAAFISHVNINQAINQAPQAFAPIVIQEN